MRKGIDQKSLDGICERFLDLAQNHLGLSLKKLSEELKYTNQSTLTKVNKHEGFIGPDKLKMFGELRDSNGKRPNIDYIITGEQPKFLEGTAAGLQSHSISSEEEFLSKELIEKLGVQKVKKLIDVFSS